jgi:hypothetical protein
VVRRATTEDTMDNHVERATAALAAARAQRSRFHEAILGLEHAAAAPAHGREQAWAATVCDALTQVREALAQHMAVTEGPGCLYEEIREMAPGFDRRLEDLARDHDVLVDELEAASAVFRDDLNHSGVEAARDAVTGLLVRLFDHRQRGVDLVYEAYTTDIGVGA